MLNIILGNVLSVIGALIAIAMGQSKSKNGVVVGQTLQACFGGVANFLLGGYTGIATSLVSIVRNLISFKWKFTTAHKVIFIIIQLALGISLNNLGFIGFLPLVGVCIFTWYLDTDDVVVMKSIIIFMQICWCIFDTHLMNYSMTVLDIFTAISNFIGILRDIKRRKQQNAESAEE